VDWARRLAHYQIAQPDTTVVGVLLKVEKPPARQEHTPTERIWRMRMNVLYVLRDSIVPPELLQSVGIVPWGTTAPAGLPQRLSIPVLLAHIPVPQICMMPLSALIVLLALIALVGSVLSSIVPLDTIHL
jgi:hypothetical protein